MTIWIIWWSLNGGCPSHHGFSKWSNDLDDFGGTLMTEKVGLYTCGPSPIAHAKLCKVTNDVYLDNVVGLDVSEVVVGGN